MSDSSSSLSEQSGSKSLVSVQLQGIQNEPKEKSKDYYFEKEDDDYKNFLNICKDLQDIEEKQEEEGDGSDSNSL